MGNILINPISFKKKEEQEYLTIDEFREATKDLEGDTIIVIAKDDYNDQFSPLVRGFTSFYVPENNKNTGEIWDEEALYEVPYGYIMEQARKGDIVKCIALIPASNIRQDI